MSEQSIDFDRAVEYYDETRGFPPEEVEHIGKFVGDQLPPQAQVLEVGVGTGRIALPVAPYAAAYYGLDLSLPMMARLRSKQQTGHIFLAQGDATRLPYPDDYFDAAITVHIFHLIPGWQTALAELARVLKPEGQLFNCWGDSEPHPKGNLIWNAYEAAVPAQQRKRPGVDFDQDKDFLGSAGWQRVGDSSHHYQSVSTPGRFLSGLRRRIQSSMWKLTDEELAAGIAAVEQVIAQEFSGPDDPIVYEMVFRVQRYLPPGS